jgi:hypothetical protein
MRLDGKLGIYTDMETGVKKFMFTVNYLVPFSIKVTNQNVP